MALSDDAQLFYQRPAKELKSRRFPISPLQFGQESWPLLLGACLPHDRAAVPRLGLTRWLPGRSIGQQIVHCERPWMRGVGIEGMDYRRPFENQADPGVAMTVNPPLVTLGQAKPPLQVEMIPDRLVVLLPDEQTVQKAEHHRGHA